MGDVVNSTIGRFLSPISFPATQFRLFRLWSQVHIFNFVSWEYRRHGHGQTLERASHSATVAPSWLLFRSKNRHLLPCLLISLMENNWPSLYPPLSGLHSGLFKARFEKFDSTPTPPSWLKVFAVDLLACFYTYLWLNVAISIWQPWQLSK